MVSVPDKPPALLKPAVALGPQIPIQQARLQARIDTVYSTDWTQEEQVALDATLDKIPVDRHGPLERYVKAAAALPKKGVRDVALRVKWLSSTAVTAKRRLSEDSAGKKRPRIQSIFAVQPKETPSNGVPASGVPAAVPTTAQPVAVQGIFPALDDHGSTTVGMVSGPMAQLLEQNYLILNQYKQNMQQYKVHENTELLVRFRDNILTILNQMSSMSGLMRDMPPLPVRLNIELASNFLPKAGAGMFAGGSQPIFPGNGIPGTGGYRMPPEIPVPLQPSMKVSTVVPVSSANTTKSSPNAQETKSGSGRSRSKGGSRKAQTAKADEKSFKARSELRTSARRAAQKPSTVRSETRTSARLAAATDLGED